MNSPRQQFVEALCTLARSQVGYREVPKGSNRGAAIDLYTGARAEPWCGHFVAWCFRIVGWSIPNDTIPSNSIANPLAGVAYMLNVFRTHGWVYNEPRVGDVVFYMSRGGSDAGRGMHCGIVVNVSGTTIETVEGNWSDAVCLRKFDYTKSNPAIAGFGRRP